MKQNLILFKNNYACSLEILVIERFSFVATSFYNLSGTKVMLSFFLQSTQIQYKLFKTKFFLNRFAPVFHLCTPWKGHRNGALVRNGLIKWNQCKQMIVIKFSEVTTRLTFTCSKSSMETLEKVWNMFRVNNKIVDIEHISHLFLMFL